jgi:glycosyltransferase involved in cell wall biosynthesis
MNSIRTLHVLKTSTGGGWALAEAAELIRLGVDVHAALPDGDGPNAQLWKEAGATVHIVPLEFPVQAPWRLASLCDRTRRLVADVEPDIIHSHFVSTTLTLRVALGKHHRIPRIFQVPGPLHLEHALYRTVEVRSAGTKDYWIASSRFIQKLYMTAGVERERVFLSYYGGYPSRTTESRSGDLRARLGVKDSQLLVGNISFMYAPKYYLGQRVGIKGHEDLIATLKLVTDQRPDVIGALVGGAWDGAAAYEQKLRRSVARLAPGRILMPGPLQHGAALTSWADFDCVIHAPLSENCGGVVEPLFAAVPTVTVPVGGLPEVIIDGLTGSIVSRRTPRSLADSVLEVLDNQKAAKRMAKNGQALVRTMFDVHRTAREILSIYRRVLAPSELRPQEFDSLAFARNVAAPAPAA